MSVADLLNKLPAAFNPAAAQGSECTIQFNTSTPMHAVIKNGACSINPGAATNPDVTLTMGDQDLIDLLKGDLNGMTAFMTGKLQIDGDLMLAQKITGFFDASKLA
jgi:putative sterol carrier protein